MDLWNDESLEWYDRLEELYDFISTINPTTRNYIWHSFDKQRQNRLGTKLYIPKLLYSYIVLLIKSKNKQAVAPKFKKLKHILIFCTLEMINLMPMEQKINVQKVHYDQCFLLYLEQILDNKSNLVNNNSANEESQ